MRRRTLTVTLCVALTVSVGPTAPSQEKIPDVWKPFQFFVGKWEGAGEGKPGISQGTQEFAFVLGGRYLQVRNEAIFDPQEKNPKGEKHEDWGFFSYDQLRKAYVFRQFHVEGFVNQYVCPAPSGDGLTFVFLSEAIENLPPGFKAKLTYRILDDNSFEQTFDVAAPGQEMECYSKGIMTRVGAKTPTPKARKKPPILSPNYEVRIFLDLSSPLVPDGRMSLAEFSLGVMFGRVTFEFNPDDDPLLGRCQVHTAKGKGKISKLVLNDVQKDEERLPAVFLSARPAEFPAGLSIESEPMADDEAAVTSTAAPEKVRLAFWTEFGQAAVKWGSKFGTATLADFRIVFEVPFRDLLRGKSYSLTLPYEGRYAEDKGTWKIKISPKPKKS